MILVINSKSKNLVAFKCTRAYQIAEHQILYKKEDRRGYNKRWKLYENLKMQMCAILFGKFENLYIYFLSNVMHKMPKGNVHMNFFFTRRQIDAYEY